MKLIVYLLFLLGVLPKKDLAGDTSWPSSTSTSGPFHCPHPPLSYLPGSGWDILTNADRSPMVEARYDKCRLTPDGLYTVPDDVVVESVRESKVQLFSSELIEDWSQYADVTSRSYLSTMRKNLLGAPSSIIGTYSPDFLRAKRRLIAHNASIARVCIRHVLYRIRLQPSTPLHPNLGSRFEELLSLFRSNQTAKARYLLESFINDHGTHYTTHVDVGAILMEENDIKKSYLNTTADPKNLISEAASQLFLKMIQFRNDFPVDSTFQGIMNRYQLNRLASFVESFGGSALKQNMTLDNWLDEAAKYPAIIDRGGEHILGILREEYFPSLSRNDFAVLQNELEIALKKYYLYNVHSGCTDSQSTNFDYAVNIGDASCNGTALFYAFGGFYQKCFLTSHSSWNPCTKFSLNTKNPLANGYACTREFREVLLIDNDTYSQCSRQCNDSGCEEACYTIRAYWCVLTNLTPRSQLYFGGIYSDNLVNPVTGEHFCPPGYGAFRLGSEVWVCAGTNSQQNLPYRIPFGGFLTEDIGNPLATSLDSNFSDTEANIDVFGCPVGYSRHLAAAESTYSPRFPLSIIKYCMRSNVLKNQQFQMPLISPPFISRDILFESPFISSTVEPEVVTSGLSNGYVVAIVLGLLLVFVLSVAGVYVYRQRQYNAEQPHREGEALINSETEPSVE